MQVLKNGILKPVSFKNINIVKAIIFEAAVLTEEPLKINLYG